MAAQLFETIHVKLDAADFADDVRKVIDGIVRDLGILDDREQLEALIPAMRQSAQGTLAALHGAGFRIVRGDRD